MESPEEYSTAQISVSGNDAVASSDEILFIMALPLTPDPPAAMCCVTQRCVTGQCSWQLLQTENVTHMVERNSTRDI
jgi:hypothetical protein